MSIEDEIVERILNVHDSEFVSYSLYFREAAYYFNFGKWYWPLYFYATLDALMFWSFEIGGVTIVNEKLNEKFDRIYLAKMKKIENKRSDQKEKELQKIWCLVNRKSL